MLVGKSMLKLRLDGSRPESIHLHVVVVNGELGYIGIFYGRRPIQDPGSHSPLSTRL